MISSTDRQVRDLLLPGLPGHLTKAFGVNWKADGWRAEMTVNNGGIVVHIRKGGAELTRGLISAKQISTGAYRDIFATRLAAILEEARTALG